MPESFNKDLGPCVLEFDGTSLGQTIGDVLFKAELTAADVKENQHGQTPVDKVHTGILGTVEVPCTRSTMAQLAAIFPEASLAAGVLTFKNPVGGNQPVGSSKS